MPDPKPDARLRAAIESLPDLVAVLDHDWIFQYVNESAALRLGKKAEEIVGHSALELLPSAPGTGLANHLLLCRDEGQPCQFFEPSLDGARWFDHRVYPLDGGVMLISRDVTEERESLQEREALLASVQEAHRQSEALNRLSKIVYTEPDMNAVLDCVVDEGRRALGAESAIMDVLDDGELVLEHSSGEGSPARGRRLDPELAPHLIAAADSGHPVAVDDTALDDVPGVGESVRASVRSVLAVPLLVLGDVLGFLSFNWHSEAHYWTEAEIDFAKRLGVAASLALENVAAREDLNASQRKFRATFDQAAVGMAHVGVDGQWLRVNDAICEITGYSRAELMSKKFQDITYEPDLAADTEQVEALLRGDISSYSMEKRYVRPDGTLTWANITVSLVLSKGAPDYFVSIVESIDDRKRAEEQLRQSRAREDLLTRLLEDAAQPFAAATKDGEIVLCNDAFVELTGLSATELDRPHGHRCADVSVERWNAFHESVLGRIGESSGPLRYEQDYRRPDGECLPIEVFAHVFEQEPGPALVYMFITDITERFTTRQAGELGMVLNEIDAEINRTLEFDSIMSSMLQLSSGALEVDTAAVTMLDGDEYEIAYVYGFPPETIGTRLLPEDIPHAELAVRNRSTIVIEDAPNDPRTNHEVIARFGVQSVIVVPLIRANEVYGAIFFNHAEAARGFTRPQVDFATKLGAHVSLAVENAALLENEHRIAETLQNALLTLPERMSGIDFASEYRSSSSVTKVGGDFYDLFELEDGQVGMVVGDVSGKGLEAASLNARARASLRAELGTGGKTPAEVLKRVNEMLVRESQPETFFTVFLGLLDRTSGRLTYASGGHTTSALVHPDGTVDRLPSTGPLVGAFLGMEFENAFAQLAPDDVLFAYTDGLTEARGVTGMFGEQRLFERLAARAGMAPRELVDGVVKDVLGFAPGLYDDVAVLAVQRTGR